MPIKNNYNSVNLGFYNVPQREPIRMNLDAFSKSIDKIDEKNQKALQQRTAIDVALSQVELDSSEDEWKFNYAQRIRDKIDAQAEFGDYSRALNTATMLAGTAVSSPELIGRQRAHKDREEAWSKVQSRNDIDEDTKRAWNLTNKYYYKDNYNDKGDIIGGTKWQSSWTPVAHVDVVPELAKAVSLIAAEKAGSSSTTGGTTVKEDGTSTGGQQSSSSSYQRLTADRINKQLKDYIESNPQLKASILQEYNVNKILLKDAKKKLANATDPEEAQTLRDEIAMREGNITNHNGINTGDYMTLIYKKYGNVIKNFAYNWTESSSTNISNTDNYVKGGGSGVSFSYNPNTGKYDVQATSMGQGVEQIGQQLLPIAQSLNNTNQGLDEFLNNIPWAAPIN